MTQRRIRVLVADDSKTIRDLLVEVLGRDPTIEVVGQARDGVEAVDLARTRGPDVITMDVRMPRMNGFQAIELIMAEAPSRILVICAVGDETQVDLSFRAIAAGALEVIPKPTGAMGNAFESWGKELLETVHLMADVPVVRRARRARRPESVLPPRTRRVDVFALVASTGGPPALAQILAELPGDLPIPMLIAQHMALGFAAGLARWLADVTPLKIVTAKEGDEVRPGHVYMPPDGLDVELVQGGRLHLRRTDSLHWPSGDHLLESVASSFGARAGAAVLTGMGSDGSQGLLALRRAGGVTLAQDEASCVVYGMPQAAVTAGAVLHVTPLASMAMSIRGLAF